MLRARQKIGKYRILGRIASGPMADVYKAYDTIQKQRVALKIPTTGSGATEEEFLHEVQVATKLRHPNILSVLNASYIDEHFVIAMELGEQSLADRIEHRTSTARALDLAGQAIASLAYAHEHRIIHCDIKPENFILFPGNQLKLADFGFAKLSLRTLKASGSGTIDYIAPEQAMGRPKFQSDVFSLGLVLYRLFSGKLPEWPFEWPLPGQERLMARVRPEFAAMLRKAIQLDPKKRYRDAVQMRTEFERLQSQFPDQGISIIGYAQSSGARLVRSSSTSSRGKIHYCHSSTASCSLIESVAPWLDELELFETVAFDVESTDDIVVEVYLTLPADTTPAAKPRDLKNRACHSHLSSRIFGRGSVNPF